MNRFAPYQFCFWIHVGGIPHVQAHPYVRCFKTRKQPSDLPHLHTQGVRTSWPQATTATGPRQFLAPVKFKSIYHHDMLVFRANMQKLMYVFTCFYHLPMLAFCKFSSPDNWSQMGLHGSSAGLVLSWEIKGISSHARKNKEPTGSLSSIAEFLCCSVRLAAFFDLFSTPSYVYLQLVCHSDIVSLKREDPLQDQSKERLPPVLLTLHNRKTVIRQFGCGFIL